MMNGSMLRRCVSLGPTPKDKQNVVLALIGEPKLPDPMLFASGIVQYTVATPKKCSLVRPRRRPLLNKENVRLGLWGSNRSKHMLLSTGARQDKSWANEMFPTSQMKYPPLKNPLGHSLRFPKELTLSPRGEEELHRLLIVLTYMNPDCVYCPFLVQIIPVLLQQLCVDDVFAVAEAMIARSRKDSWYFSLTNSEFNTMAATIEEVARGLPVPGSIFVSGEVLGYFPVETQLHIVDCLLAEGRKIIFRLAMVLASQPSADALTAFCAAQTNSASFLRSAFSIQLSRNDIFDSEKRVVGRGRAHSASESAPRVPFWPDPVKIVDCSSLLDAQQWMWLWSWLHARHQHVHPQLLFSSPVHGFNLGTLYRASAGYQPLLLLVRDSLGSVFGAFLSLGIEKGWQVDPEAFVFSFRCSPPQAWGCSGVHSEENIDDDDSFVCKLGDDFLSISLHDTPVLLLSRQLIGGRSAPSDRLGNFPLAATDSSMHYSFRSSQVDLLGGF